VSKYIMAVYVYTLIDHNLMIHASHDTSKQINRFV